MGKREIKQGEPGRMCSGDRSLGTEGKGGVRRIRRPTSVSLLFPHTLGHSNSWGAQHTIIEHETQTHLSSQPTQALNLKGFHFSHSLGLTKSVKFPNHYRPLWTCYKSIYFSGWYHYLEWPQHSLHSRVAAGPSPTYRLQLDLGG